MIFQMPQIHVFPSFARSTDSDDYTQGFESGKAGAPDPRGRAPYGYWLGWRDGAAQAGFLPRTNIFRRRA